MEQAYRRLIRKLEEHPLVEEVINYNYYEIKLRWKSGIRERLVINRKELTTRKRISYLKSSMYRPHFMPYATWWEDLSNGTEITPNYLEGVNDIEHDLDQFSNLVNWKWADFATGKFFDKLIAIHTILQHVIDNGWQRMQYPEQTLHKSLNMLVEDKVSAYERNDVLIVKSFSGGERPGVKLLEHYMPYGCYGQDNASYLFRATTPKDRKRIYLAIRNIIDKNKAAYKKGRKKMLDFNYVNIMKCIRKVGAFGHKTNPYKFRQIGLYRRMIRRLELDGKSFYDIDPLMGEKALACFCENVPYYYRETCPFDECGPPMLDYIGADYEVADDDLRYDFSILDRGLVYEQAYFEECFELLSQKVDTLLVFIPDTEYDEWIKTRPPDEYHRLKYSGRPLKTGRLLVYNF